MRTSQHNRPADCVHKERIVTCALRFHSCQWTTAKSSNHHYTKRPHGWNVAHQLSSPLPSRTDASHAVLVDQNLHDCNTHHQATRSVLKSQTTKSAFTPTVTQRQRTYTCSMPDHIFNGTPAYRLCTYMIMTISNVYHFSTSSATPLPTPMADSIPQPWDRNTNRHNIRQMASA